jgi:hypothetical protein
VKSRSLRPLDMCHNPFQAKMHQDSFVCWRGPEVMMCENYFETRTGENLQIRQTRCLDPMSEPCGQ